ncbi:MAG: WSD1 family O-acyltransferase [Actinomycetia bacterium]|nr:WSD1 family O-acyltransferase [Actinomycetes bacterium]
MAISNVPGPSRTVASGGRRVQRLFPSSEPAAYHALRISAMPCAGAIGIGFCIRARCRMWPDSPTVSRRPTRSCTPPPWCDGSRGLDK